MGDVAYALSLGLAVVFAAAGIAKLRAPRRTERAFRALGVPTVLARVVPLVELAFAVSLVVAPRSALLAAALLVAFSFVLARADDGVSCACFGSASSIPVSWVQQVRNGMLIVIALVASTGTPGLPTLAAVLTACGVGAIALVVLALADVRQRVGSIMVGI
jgi:hypothetical protein